MINKLSIIISCYNEEGSVPKFYEAVVNELSDFKIEYELIFVDDGSTDLTKTVIKEIISSEKSHGIKRSRLISFSRNFGHEAAMIAGVDYAEGDFIICMDADLQHPVNSVVKMLEKANNGADVIMMVRNSNRSTSRIKKITSKIFYKFLSIISNYRIEENASDFFGISKRAAQVVRKNYREKTRFLRGYIQNLGYRQEVLYYDADERVSGHSKYSIKKLIRFAIETIVSFSDFPFIAGCFAGTLAVILWIWNMLFRDPGTSKTIILYLCFFFSIAFYLTAFIGKTLTSLLLEVKDRPIYIVEETEN